MKKIFILLMVSTLAIGQNFETQFKNMAIAFDADPAGTLQKNATGDFYFISGEGQKINKSTLIASIKGGIAKMENTFSNLEFRDLGSVVSVTGNIHQEMDYKDNTHKTWAGLFTYVYKKEGNNYTVSSMHHTNSSNNTKTDETAIKKVIEGQTQASYDRNAEKALSYWANVPHASYVLTSLNANLTGFNQIKNTYTFFIKTNPTPDKSKIETSYKSITIKGNTAFVKHAEAFTSEKGITTKQNCHRYLEKINNEWKLVGSVVTPMPTIKTEDEAAIKNVIVAETQAYLDGHPEKITDYWSNKGSDEFQSQQIIAWIGQPFAKAETLNKLNEAAKSLVKKQEIKIDRADFEIRINKDMAWATYTQKAIANGTVAQTIRETRILERIGGEWKIVYVGEQGVK